MEEKPTNSTLSMVRSWLLLQVEDGFPTVDKFQRFFGAGQKRDFLNIVSFPEAPSSTAVAAAGKEKAAARTSSEDEDSAKAQDQGVKTTLKHRQNGSSATTSLPNNKGTNVRAARPEQAAKIGFFTSLFFFVCEIYFRFASMLGEEVTFVLLLPFLWWHFVTELAESVVFLWCFSCYLGHMLKDLLQLPRPYAHTVKRLEHHYECEYGLPSTHAIAATTLPLCIALYCYRHTVSEPYVYISIGLAFWISVCLSRMYLGVHSPSDLFWGTLVGVGCFYLWVNINEHVDYVLDTSPIQVMMAMPVVLAALLAIYPAPAQWTNSYGDTATILGALNGGLLHMGMFGKVNLYRLNFSDLFSSETCLIAFARIFVGYLVVFMTRLIMKKASFIFLSSILPAKAEQTTKQRYMIEIPAKFINYTVVCLSATAWAPLAMNTIFS
jgi:membrane-associated phospholipid phosphatase